MYKMDELLLLEHLTYTLDHEPLTSILKAEGKTVGEYLDSIDLSALDPEYVYCVYMTGHDWKNVLLAMKKNTAICEAVIAETHLDEAYGGGGGISAVFLHGQEEAVVAFRGTAENEWADDFLGANQTDSLQQINALEWYKKVYDRLGLEDYSVTVIGHSKGGNKAKYITVLNDTPARCVSFDGQGFSDKFFEQYRRQIQKRQGVIENHNIDFDYVNILMNDIGSRTYYIGYDYGRFGFAEAHSPNTFFDFTSEGVYSMRVNPNGQSPEMQIMDQFINSMIRSAVSEKEKDETNQLVGYIVQQAFTMEDKSVGGFINFLCDMIGNRKYSDNTAYLFAYIILYSRKNPEFIKALKNVMLSFKADHIVKIIDMFGELLNSRRLKAVAGISNFLILHVNGAVVRKIQSIARSKYEVELSEEQIRGVLQIVSMTMDNIKTMELNMDGSDLIVEAYGNGDEDELELPENLNVVVLAGGLSNERNLSLKCGVAISDVLRECGHKVILLDAFMGYGEEEEDLDRVFEEPAKYSLEPKNISDEIPDLWAVKKRRADQSPSYFGPNVLQICRQCDIVFIALHGANGENGKVQAAFDLHGIDYTGCDYFSSAISSNKYKAKELMANAGVGIPRGCIVNKNKEMIYPEDVDIAYPVIVKPNNGGIGLGISVASDRAMYVKAVRDAFRWDSDILVEEYVSGREFSVGTIDGEATPVLEMLRMPAGDGDTGMNMKGETVKRCPAEISPELTAKLQEAAETVTEVLGVTAYANMDFIVRDDESFFCLECDSLPQLYPDSHLVLEARAEGMSFEDLCEKIMKMSLIKRARA